MLSCHLDPFVAFCKDLQIKGCEVHLYRGAKNFGMILGNMLPQVVDWWDTDNIYFLGGVKPKLTKRAADVDVLQRNMFTLDFDIRNELVKMKPENTDQEVTDEMVEQSADAILNVLLEHSLWSQFRYVVMSGNGMHVHYFSEPIYVIKDEWAAGMKDIFAEIAEITPIPPDFGCGNAGRIMRMPGSWNVKGGGKKPVEFLAWQEGVSLPPLKFVLERGKKIIKDQAELKMQERANFESANPAGGSDVVDIINAIPIEQIVWQVLGCKISQIKKDGGARFVDEKGKERGFFKHREHNIIVHEGTSAFSPPTGVGYNCLGLVKECLGLEAADAIAWFGERSARVRDAIAQEKEAWAKENAAKEVVFVDSYYSK